jgi:hypothetical protein
MFDKVVWTSLLLELLIPLIVSSSLFWWVIFPKCISEVKKVMQKLLLSLNIDACNPILLSSVKRLTELKTSLDTSKTSLDNDTLMYVIICNVLIIVILLILAVTVPIIFRVPPKAFLLAFVEVLGIYIMVGIAQIFFIREIAFKYMPLTSEVFQKVVGQLMVSCFDTTLKTPLVISKNKIQNNPIQSC